MTGTQESAFPADRRQRLRRLCHRAFTLYEDAGDGYGYEEDACCRTRITWDEETEQVDWVSEGDLAYRQGELQVKLIRADAVQTHEELEKQ